MNDSFKITITLKTIFISDGIVHLDITNISCTEPSFGAGGSGSSTALLPADPSGKHVSNTAFSIIFANGNIGAGFSGKVYISPDGQTISNSVGSNGTLEGSTTRPWSIQGPSGFGYLPSGHFSLAAWGKWGWYAVSWSFAKTSS